MKKNQDDEKMGWYLVFVPKGIQNQFHIIREYIESSEKFILKESQEIKKDIDAEYETFTEFIRTSESYKHEEISRIIRNNCFVSAVSLFEAHFRLIVDYLPGKKPTLMVRELSGPELEKPFTYLTKVLGYNLQSLDEGRKQLSQYYNIRNRIVHHLGYALINNNVDEAHQNGTYKFIKSLSGIELNQDSGRITISNKAFIIEFCNLGEKFLLDCVGLMRKAYKE